MDIPHINSENLKCVIISYNCLLESDSTHQIKFNYDLIDHQFRIDSDILKILSLLNNKMISVYSLMDNVSKKASIVEINLTNHYRDLKISNILDE